MLAARMARGGNVAREKQIHATSDQCSEELPGGMAGWGRPGDGRQGLAGRAELARPTPAVITEINRVVRGWAGYFHVQHCGRAFSALRRFVTQRVRLYLRRKHRRRSWSYRMEIGDEIGDGHAIMIFSRREDLGEIRHATPRPPRLHGWILPEGKKCHVLFCLSAKIVAHSVGDVQAEWRGGGDREMAGMG